MMSYVTNLFALTGDIEAPSAPEGSVLDTDLTLERLVAFVRASRSVAEARYAGRLLDQNI